MAAHTEDELKALKVVDLKHLLSEANLPTSGRKEELIARLLNSESTENSNSEPMKAIERQDSTTASASNETKTSEETISTSIPAADAASSVEIAEKTTSTGSVAAPSEEKTASNKEIDEEIEKRKSRAARFGVPYVDTKDTTVRPKTNTIQPPKAAAATAKPTSEKVLKSEPAKVLDPVEEEKKRKRLEKFGPVRPVAEEKKAKTAA
ncbi:Putative nucleic acid-binding protein Hcc-1/proliferation associated cytokine-inducible protein, contains SAP domain [Phaffia rhodozyma]|uniref:Putative nucleic acid-binding protein Hcc-1/proliferation associated cytokine-inducible protein, contains SAP domain n=1 Tax=Phaffia rhodozyma TaxID=264483 RepID=A0A0F7SIV8_PHARH|nr:Putative nucleic acid-binding protein Hcc-1/proliferation associated cytokine-inducible protein, contains SAP domain [Phaffia rhodozyma]